jgi:hypothetical protein
MRKIQVFLREDQKEALKSISVRTGRKQSDLIRGSVDLLIDAMKREDSDRREATRSAAGLWKDRTDLEDISRQLRAAAKRRFSSVYEPT